MATINIDVSMDSQKCWKCGKTGKGYYKTINGDGYVCQSCVIKTIKSGVVKHAKKS